MGLVDNTAFVWERHVSVGGERQCLQHRCVQSPIGSSQAGMILHLARLADAVRARNSLLLVLRVGVRVIDDLQPMWHRHH